MCLVGRQTLLTLTPSSPSIIWTSRPSCIAFLQFGYVGISSRCIFFRDFRILFNLSAAESSPPSVDGLVTKVAVVDSVVNLICTLGDNCTNKSIQWSHQSPHDTVPELWYINNSTRNPKLELNGVSVEVDTANGRSTLTIPRARLEDRGIFLCRMTGFRHCQMQFRLTITGNKYLMSILSSCR